MGVMPNSTGAQMTKHTPGPWLVDRWPTKHHGCYGWSIRPVRQDTGAITGHQICCQYEAPHAVNFNLPADGSTDEANLRLIAAAPELLAACEAVFKAHDTFLAELPESLEEQLSAAIKKATGE